MSEPSLKPATISLSNTSFGLLFEKVLIGEVFSLEVLLLSHSRKQQ